MMELLGPELVTMEANWQCFIDALSVETMQLHFP